MVLAPSLAVSWAELGGLEQPGVVGDIPVHSRARELDELMGVYYSNKSISQSN